MVINQNQSKFKKKGESPFIFVKRAFTFIEYSIQIVNQNQYLRP